ncbi:MAG: tRNA 2-thiouridine(34) synthase MnmA [Hydrogenophilus sp.]|nr:tRNA 2-thiouridine(34) synthase MnmA [Hydrogenophilus sp.]
MKSEEMVRAARRDRAAGEQLLASLNLQWAYAAVPEGKGRRVRVGLSGGVDSAVAAWLLRLRGWEVVGVFMKNWEDRPDEPCSSRTDWVDAASVADCLGIEVEHVNFSATYWERVFQEEFLAEYAAGRTPNPDVWCNSEVKFSAFLNYALEQGAEAIATGHYAGVEPWCDEEGRVQYRLVKGVDGSKDQSYFLYRLTQEQLARTIFPLARFYKRDVRRLAAAVGLPVATKRDSTGICFIGERPLRTFLGRFLPARRGEIRELGSERVLGEHPGVVFFTIGQRQGLGIGGVRGCGERGYHAPWYVAAKDIERNILYVVQGHDHPALFADRLRAVRAHWIAGKPPQIHWVYTAKGRYRTGEAACEVEWISRDGEAMEVAFAAPQWALTPGQSVVLYESRVCLGGGVIDKVWRTEAP